LKHAAQREGAQGHCGRCIGWRHGLRSDLHDAVRVLEPTPAAVPRRRSRGAGGARPPGAERSGCFGRTVGALVGWATSLCSFTVEPCPETRLAE